MPTEPTSSVTDHLDEAQLREAVTGLFKERNRLAREVADLKDEIAALRDEYARSQELNLIERARLQVAAGGTEDSISDEARDDGERIAQIVLDKVWHEGYLDALHHAFDLLHSEHIIATRQGWRNYAPSKLTEQSA